MNKKLYRKSCLYRLFFIDELRERKYRRTTLKLLSRQRKAAKLALEQFESDMKRQNYGAALAAAQLYFLLSNDF